MREITQTTLELMDKVPKQLASICSDLQEQIHRAVEQAQIELKSHLVVVMDKKVALLEVRMEAQYNEVHAKTIFSYKELQIKW